MTDAEFAAACAPPDPVAEARARLVRGWGVPTGELLPAEIMLITGTGLERMGTIGTLRDEDRVIRREPRTRAEFLELWWAYRDSLLTVGRAVAATKAGAGAMGERDFTAEYRAMMALAAETAGPVVGVAAFKDRMYEFEEFLEGRLDEPLGQPA